jgi:hypothetical protein
LDCLDVGPGRHGEDGGSVPELVGREAREPRVAGRAVEGPLSEVADP